MNRWPRQVRDVGLRSMFLGDSCSLSLLLLGRGWDIETGGDDNRIPQKLYIITMLSSSSIRVGSQSWFFFCCKQGGNTFINLPKRFLVSAIGVDAVCLIQGLISFLYNLIPKLEFTTVKYGKVLAAYDFLVCPSVYLVIRRGYELLGLTS